MKKIYLLFMLFTVLSYGQTTFQQGEVFVIGYGGDGAPGGVTGCDDGFSIVSYVDILPNTQLRFSEEDFDQWGGSEGEILWNSGGTTIPALTPITFTTHTSTLSNNNDCPTNSSVTSGSFTYDFSSWNLATSNEEIYIYQSSVAHTVQSYIISAFYTDTPTTVPPTSILNPDHIVNITAFDSDADVAVYSGTVTFTNLSNFISEITNVSTNWTTQDGGGDNINDGIAPDFPENIAPFSPTLSISDTSFVNTFKVYPNPTNGNYIYIKSKIDGIKNVTIYNMLGKQIMQQKTESDIDISKLNNGIYLLRINQNNKDVTVKLVVQ